MVASLVAVHDMHRLQELQHMNMIMASGLLGAGSVVQCTGLVALWHVGYSWTRSQTIVPAFAEADS